jgi:WD40-like Beta Propeller Repeat
MRHRLQALLALAAVVLAGALAAPGAGAREATRIVYAAQGKLLAVPPRGGRPRLLARLPAGTSDVAPSADGRRFALIVNRTRPSSKRGSLRTIYLLRPGHGMRMIRRFRTRGPLDIALSPRGDEIAFVKGVEIWTVEVDGDWERQVTDGPGVAFEPAYEPSGRALVYVRSGRGPSQLLRTRADGSREEPLGLFECRMPSFARDGRMTFFRDAEGAVPYRLVVMDRDGSGRHTVDRSNDPIFDTDPFFSPNGRSIAFRRLYEKTGLSEDYRYSLWTVRADGSHRHRLVSGLRVTPGQGGPIGPFWLPAL